MDMHGQETTTECGERQDLIIILFVSLVNNPIHIYKYKVVISVCLDVISHKPLDRFVSNSDGELKKTTGMLLA